jgi:L-fuconolactonase
VTIIDTHVHLASGDRTRYPLRPGLGLNDWYEHGAADVDALLAEMDGACVAGAVLVQSHGAYGFDNAYCADARERDPRRLVSASSIDMTRLDREAQLVHWATDRGMGGTRVLHVPPPDPPWLDDRATRAVWLRAAELGIRVSVCIVRRHLPALRRLLEWAPDIPISLDHAGLVELPGSDVGVEALDELVQLAAYPTLHVKVSPQALAYAGTAGCSEARLVRVLADAFGARRLMWCSDWPNAGRSYAAHLDRAKAAASLLSDEERADLLGGTALRLWPELARAHHV